MPSTIVKANDNTAPEPSPSLDRHSISEGDIDANLNPSSSPFVDSTLDTFTLFPKVPLEIQLNIWNMSLPGPRVVSLLLYVTRNPSTV
jgi:hypothetical protein